MSPLFDLTGRTALVTGSSRGIGNALARALADAGATVVLNGVNAERLKAAEAVAWVEDNVGPLEILVNNAGIQHRVAMLDLDVKDWERVISTDLTSAFLVGRAAARFMVPRGRGKIINICSVQTDLARPTIAPYIAAKGGLRNLTRAMTAEWAAAGLQINALAPGYIHTEMTQNLVDDEQFNSWILGRTPAHRWGTPEDLAGPAVWLASSGSDFVNGQTIFIDGGMTVVV
jgi:gluconate 5-dehydrogenase